ncbi:MULTISPECIES: hypothetical protein [Arthrobacter]|uniref:hypothetical protein n=1 Tax=Arthrobacter TaxID=1663 RepID=UPI0012B50EF3|nr:MULTISPECIES: hypothetical protein [Arthrobacter]
MESSRRKVLTVAEVIQEHIDLLVRPASGTLRTYQTMLDLHIKPVQGAILIDELDMRQGYVPLSGGVCLDTVRVSSLIMLQ